MPLEKAGDEIIVYGSYQLLWPEDARIYAYTRTWEGQRLLVVCNLSGEGADISVPKEFSGGELLISNFNDTVLDGTMALRPWEAFAVLKKPKYTETS